MPCLSGIQSPSVGKTITIACSKKIPNSSEIRAFSAKAATVSDMRSSRFRIPACIPFTVENNAIFGTPVFILFGLNDISIWGVQGTADNYAEVISNIRRESPETEIYVISAMYMFKGSEHKMLNNKNIYALNKLLAEMCRENGYEFVNIASNLIDEGGFLPKEYCSDNYVHQTYSAYAVWADVLRSLAARHITGQGKLVFE